MAKARLLDRMCLALWARRTMAPLHCAAKFDPFLSLDCAPMPSTLAQSNERKGSNFAIWQPWTKAAKRARSASEAVPEEDDDSKTAAVLIVPVEPPQSTKKKRKKKKRGWDPDDATDSISDAAASEPTFSKDTVV